METAYSTLHALRALGLEFSIRGAQLAVGPRALITADIRETIKAHRDQILRQIKCESRPPCLHDVLERAAILEFDGGSERTNADRLALAEFGLSSWDELSAPSAGRAEP